MIKMDKEILFVGIAEAKSLRKIVIWKIHKIENSLVCK